MDDSLSANHYQQTSCVHAEVSQTFYIQDQAAAYAVKAEEMVKNTEANLLELTARFDGLLHLILPRMRASQNALLSGARFAQHLEASFYG